MDVYVISLVLAVLSIILAVWGLIKYNELEGSLEPMAQNVALAVKEHIDEQMQPLKSAVSKTYSDRAMISADVRQVKALDKKLALDMIDLQDPLIKAALAAFPRAAEYVNKNPDLLLELLPRLQALQASGANPMDIFKPGSNDTSRGSRGKEWVWK